MKPAGSTPIFVYAHWALMPEPRLIGRLYAELLRGKAVYSFEYDREWLKNSPAPALDPDLQFYQGMQFPAAKQMFGFFSDSMPDTWGRTLMKRREQHAASKEDRPARILHDLDFLLGVNDVCRSGGLRFKNNPSEPFLDEEHQFAVPVWARLREVQAAAAAAESDEPLREWLSILLAPGSSLGGARPKANIADNDSALWIAKFPSKNDTIDKGAWEFLAYRLAIACGIEMAESRLESISGTHRTFLTRRFDRNGAQRIHIASAMTMLGKTEEQRHDSPVSYLELAEWIRFTCAQPDENLKQLWQRILFNVLISNTDDHLRNHAFVLTPDGWKLSPAYDLNPSTDKSGLSLNIDESQNDLSFELVLDVAPYFGLEKLEAAKMAKQQQENISKWRTIASEIGISRAQQEEMAVAFNAK